ncbi:MAG: hypothetical protein AAGF84_02745 [Planctomycetota bacterium]
MDEIRPTSPSAAESGKRGLFVSIGIWAVVCAILIAASYRQLGGFGGFWDDRLTLGSEHEFGAWWSGGLLLIAGLLAVATGEAVKSAAAEAAVRRKLTWAFRILGLWLAALCIDEWASLHERYDWSDIVIPRELRLPPIALAMAVTLAWSLWTMWQHRPTLGSGRNAWLPTFLIAAGFGCMGSVYAIELAEHAFTWPESWRPARLAVEEGQELLGMGLVLFAVAWHWLGQASTRDSRGESIRRAAVPLAVGLMGIAPLLIVLQHLMPLEGKWARMGVPGKAVPAMLVMLACAVAWFTYLRGRRPRWVWLATAVVLLVTGFETMTAFQRWFFEIPINKMRTDLVMLVIGTAIFGLGLAMRSRVWIIAGLVAVALNLVNFAVFKNPIMQLNATLGAFAILTAVVMVARPSISEPEPAPAG